MKGILAPKWGFSELKIPFLELYQPKMPLQKISLIEIFGIDVFD